MATEQPRKGKERTDQLVTGGLALAAVIGSGVVVFLVCADALDQGKSRPFVVISMALFAAVVFGVVFPNLLNGLNERRK